MAAPTIPNGEEHFFNILYEGNGAGQRVGKFVPFTDNGTIANSLIFNRSDNSQLSRTPSSGGNRRTFTVSFWVKLASQFGTRRIFFSQGPAGSGNNYFLIEVDTSNKLYISANDGSGGEDLSLITNRTFEDTSKFYHILFAVDTTQSTASNRAKLYVDGDQITSFSTETYFGQNYDTNVNHTVKCVVGDYIATGYGFDGYLAEFNQVDGTALTPDTFGLTDTSTGRWIPKALTGITYGTNGFRLQFGSSSALGDDTSGNTNDFSVTNLVASDQTTDSPTQNFATGLGAFQTSYAMTMSEGNLKSSASGAQSQFGKSQTTLSFDPSDSNGYYAEYTVNITSSVGSNFNTVGIGGEPSKYVVPNSSNGVFNNMVAYFEDGRVRFTNGAGTSTDISSFGSTWGNVSTPDIIGIFVKNNKIYFHKNGTYQNSADPNNETGGLDIQGTIGSNRVGFFHVGYRSSSTYGTMTANFGQKSFTYTPPTGYKKLNQDNAPETAKGITGFTWIKDRDNALNHNTYDSSNGEFNRLVPNNTSTILNTQSGVSKFLKGGIAVGDLSNINNSGASMVSWNWTANGGTTATNNDGSITSVVQANQTAGFSVITYTGTGSAGTVGHGLSSTPEWFIIKSRSVTTNWYVYHKSAGATYQLYLNLSNARDTSVLTAWNDTAPTSSVISLAPTGYGSNNASATYVIYAWHGVDGFSKFGKYTGNGVSDGPFVYTGFKPAWLLVKANNAANWYLCDAARSTINPLTTFLHPDVTDSDYSNFGRGFDFLSNGFKVRQESGYGANYSGVITFYMAFAEHPFVGDGTSPVTAR